MEGVEVGGGGVQVRPLSMDNLQNAVGNRPEHKGIRN